MTSQNLINDNRNFKFFLERDSFQELNMFPSERAPSVSSIVDGNRTTPSTSLQNLEHGDIWNIIAKSGKFPTISRERELEQVWIQKSLWTSEQQYWNLGGNSTGVQDSERKLLPAWNSVFIRMCPGMQRTGKADEREAEGIPGQWWQLCRRVRGQLSLSWQVSRPLRKTFLGRWHCENN